MLSLLLQQPVHRREIKDQLDPVQDTIDDVANVERVLEQRRHDGSRLGVSSLRWQAILRSVDREGSLCPSEREHYIDINLTYGACMISTCVNHAGQDVGNGTKIPI